MSDAVYRKQDIACEYLDLAFQLFIEQRSYFCVIHLAAAAEEILGMHLPEHERAFTKNLKAQIAMIALESNEKYQDIKARKEAVSIINYSKNNVKHMSEMEDQVTINPVHEATWWLEQALKNHAKLGLPITPAQRQFKSMRAHKIQKENGDQ
ncbi:MAG: hypothetical protein PSX71_04720 [bacterium]|nr:hypothetical protein [bacterium]